MGLVLAQLESIGHGVIFGGQRTAAINLNAKSVRRTFIVRVAKAASDTCAVDHMTGLIGATEFQQGCCNSLTPAGNLRTAASTLSSMPFSLMPSPYI